MSNELKPLVRQIADITAAAVKFNEAGGAEFPEGLFEQFAAIEGKVTAESAKSYHDLRSAILAGVNQGLGEAALPAFQANKDLQSVTGTLNILDDTAAYRVNRHKQYPIPNGDGKVVDIYGGSELSFTVRGAANVGQLKVSRQNLKSAYSVLAD